MTTSVLSKSGRRKKHLQAHKATPAARDESLNANANFHVLSPLVSNSIQFEQPITVKDRPFI